MSAHERGQLGPVDYLAGPGDVRESRLKAEGGQRGRGGGGGGGRRSGGVWTGSSGGGNGWNGSGGAAAKTSGLGCYDERPAEALETARREATLEPRS